MVPRSSGWYALIVVVCVTGAMQARFDPEQASQASTTSAVQRSGSASGDQLGQSLDYSRLVDKAQIQDRQVTILNHRQTGPAPIVTAIVALVAAFILMFAPGVFGIRGHKRFR